MKDSQRRAMWAKRAMMAKRFGYHPVPTKNTNFVADIDKRKDLIFVSSSQDVASMKDMLPKKAKEYDAFFVKAEDGDYKEVYGIEGTVPTLTKRIYRIKTK